jgi:hypothetical protein
MPVISLTSKDVLGLKSTPGCGPSGSTAFKKKAYKRWLAGSGKQPLQEFRLAEACDRPDRGLCPGARHLITGLRCLTGGSARLVTLAGLTSSFD